MACLGQCLAVDFVPANLCCHEPVPDPLQVSSNKINSSINLSCLGVEIGQMWRSGYHGKECVTFSSSQDDRVWVGRLFRNRRTDRHRDARRHVTVEEMC